MLEVQLQPTANTAANTLNLKCTVNIKQTISKGQLGFSLGSEYNTSLNPTPTGEERSLPTPTP